MEKLQKKKWLFLAAAAAFLVVWAVLGFSSRSSRPEALVKKYLKACEKQNVKKVIKCYAPELQKELREMREELKLKDEDALSGLESILSEGADCKFIVGDVVYGKESKTAKVSFAVVLNTKGGSEWEWLSDTNFETLSLVKVGNKWYIGE